MTNTTPAFKINQPVFIIPLKTKGIVKQFENGLIRVTFYKKNKNQEEKCLTKLFAPDQLSIYKNKNKHNSNKRNPKSQYQMVREFQIAFNHPAPNQPVSLSEQQALNRAKWIGEEIIELLHATARKDEDFYKLYMQFLDSLTQTYQRQLTKKYPDSVLTAQVDAFIDILYFGNGGLVETGVDPDRLFKTVHKANMSKLVNGKCLYNEEGKVVKPDNWVAPDEDIKKEIERQISVANNKQK